MSTTLSPIEQAVRNRVTICWLNSAALVDWRFAPVGEHAAYLPGTRNTLGDIQSGYASYLGCPTCEVDPTYHDDDYLAWLYSRYAAQIERHADTLL